MGEDLKEIIREIELKKIIREMEEKDLRKIIKEMEEKKEDYLKKKFELLSKFFLISSPLALIIGSLWFLIYLVFIVKDFPPSIEKSLFYYIFAISISLVIFIVYPLVFYLYNEINEVIEKKNILLKIFKILLKIFNLLLIMLKIIPKIKNEIPQIKDKLVQIINKIIQRIKNILHGIKIRDILQKIKDVKLFEKIHKIAQGIMTYLSIIIYLSVNFILFSYIVLIKGYFFIIPINNACEKFTCKMFIYSAATILFLILQGLLYVSLKDILKRIIIDKDKNALLTSITFIPTLVIIIYVFFFLTAPFYILKIGYFEANLTLDKEYVEKSGLKTYLEERCKIECLDESSNDNYCRIFKFFITCSEKCQTECLDELFKDAQNDNHCRTFKFFIFLRTSSEYIVGCSENSDVRIHIPADKVIAIEY
jgi:hypothetical protein